MMRNVIQYVIGSAVLANASSALAQQADVSPPLPNVLILLDSSGSMEKMIEGSDPEANASSTCVAGQPSQPNRWGLAMQALTGDIGPYFSCASTPRTSGGDFDHEYGINGVSPYDVNYYLPYHRPASTTGGAACVLGPGTLPGAPAGQGVGSARNGAAGLATDFPAGAIVGHLVGSSTSCVFTQQSNGMLDSARDFLRVGLMTFDNDTRAGTGVSTGNSPVVTSTPTSPFDGMWSYYQGWDTGSGGASGKPANCVDSSPFEVGARNPAAPPWEGRMFPFPADPNAPITDVRTQNDRLQLAVAAMRPYGATPIAGLLSDADFYLKSDPKGPAVTDPYVRGGCRDQYVVLITDGAPNLDLRPSCEAKGAPDGVCPYPLPEDIARGLASGSGGGRGIQTFVLGFAVGDIDTGNNLVHCADLVQNASLASVCSDPAQQAKYGACCTLQKVAIAGGTGGAYFADTPGQLQSALSVILSRMAVNTTTRTVPAYNPSVSTFVAASSGGRSNAAIYYSSFFPGVTSAWSGAVQRQRFECPANNGTYTIPPPRVDTSKGDDFRVNLDSVSGNASGRRFYAFIPAAVGSTAQDPNGNIRPYLPAGNPADGIATQAGQQVGPTPDSVVAAVTPSLLGVTGSSCPNSTGSNFLSANACAHYALDYVLGLPFSDSLPDASFATYSGKRSSAFGAIYHANPAVVGPPSSLIRDLSYEAFATQRASRPTVLYAATIDGLLHAFDTQVGQLQNNELWAFLPPGVLPKLRSSVPNLNQLALDGTPVVKDVVFERSKAHLQDASTWHTMLVAGYGSGHAGYFAIDVTDPGRYDTPGNGPAFRWQLGQVTGPKQVFGQHSATPAIATVFVDLDGTGAKELGVALLPGGSDGGPVGNTPCARAQANDAGPVSGFAKRDSVRCWSAGNGPVAGRSLSVVRIDTGEILRTFMRANDAPSTLLTAQRVVDTPLDSPMTGVPAVYPSGTGAIAEKAFVGDADGTVWKFDLTSTDPSRWKGELFIDAYNQEVDRNTTAWADGQPLAITPVVAPDPYGQVVLGIATGDQETFTTSGLNFVYSVSEKLGTDKLRAQVNWYVPLANGERVSGPMTIFDGVLYFTTFAAGATSQACSLGTAKLWGRDYINAQPGKSLATGGIPRLPPPTGSVAPLPDFIVPADYDTTLAGKIIPGVSVNVTPSCVDTTLQSDFYSAANHYAAQNLATGSYSLLAQVGGKNAGQSGAAGASFSVSLPTPRSGTVIDSWAAVVE